MVGDRGVCGVGGGGTFVFYGVVPPLVALVVAIVVSSVMKSRGVVAGTGLANAAVRISGWSAAVGVVFVMMNASLCGCGGSRELSNRSVCSANLRGIVQSMNVYAEENRGRYPVVPFAPYMQVSNEPRGMAAAGDEAGALRAMYEGPSGQAGSVPACMWVMVLTGQVSAKQYVCKSDPAVTQAAEVKDRAGNYFDNFQAGDRLSYSMAYPWNSAGETGAWWKAQSGKGTDMLPLIADMTPKQGSGNPARNLVPSAVPSQRSTWNSANHEGDGQNVGFADGHAEWCKSPDVGQDRDNIYGMSASPSHGAARFGGIPAGQTPRLEAEGMPFDVVMLPVRDAGTNGM